MVYPAGRRVNHYAFYILFAYACHCTSVVGHHQKAYYILAACYSFVEQKDALKKHEEITFFTHLTCTSALCRKWRDVIKYGTKLLMLTIPLELTKHALTKMKKAFQMLGQQTEVGEIKQIIIALESKGLGVRACQKFVQANIYCCLGSFCRDQGEYKNALENFEKALEISKTLNRSFKLNLITGANACSGFGSVYCTIGQYGKAQEKLERALHISKNRIHSEILIGRNYKDLGNLFRDKGEHDKAIEFYKKGLRISLIEDDTVGAERAWSALGTVYRRTNDFQLAIKCHEKSLELLKNLGDLRGGAQSLANLGNVYMHIGEFKKSFEYNMRSLKVFEAFGDTGGQMRSYFSLGFVCFGLALYEDQCRFLCRGISISDKLRRNFTKNDQFNMSMAKNDFYAHQLLIRGLLRLSYQKMALLVLDLGRSKALFDLLRLQSSKVSECLLERQNIQWIDEIPRIIAQKKPDSHGHISENVCRSLQGGAIVVFGFDLEDSLLTWIVTKQETFLRKWSPTRVKTARIFYENLSTVMQEHVEAFQRSSLGLNDKRDELRRKNTEAFHKSPYELQNIDIEASEPTKMNYSSETEPKVEEIGKVFRGGQNIAETVSRGNRQQANTQLRRIFLAGYMTLIAPIKDLLTGSKLIIVPADSLFLFPFSALLDRNGKNLCDRYSIHITPALHTLNFSLSMPFKPLGPALCIGNPSTGKISFQGNVVDFGSKPLPDAEEEAAECAAFFGARTLLNKEATKKNVLERMKNASVLHIAAHGNLNYGEIFLAPNPEAPSPPKEEHYLLMPEDISKFSLSARLVVLSCCHSGQGEISSEGVAGTARAFLGAGARAVLISLWALLDNETRAFMKLFYENVCKGLSVCVALQQGMKTFKGSGHGVISWAPFEIFGEDVVINCEALAEIRRLSREENDQRSVHEYIHE